MSSKKLDNLRAFCMNRWPEKMGATHGVEHWDRVAKFGQMLCQGGLIWMLYWLLPIFMTLKGRIIR